MHKTKMRGGYDKSIFKGHMIKNIDDKRKSFTPDDYFKATMYDEFNELVYGDYRLKVLEPYGIRYMRGGYKPITNEEDFAKVARKRLDMKNIRTFIPDLYIFFGNNLILIEFDEGNDHHQKSDNYRYQLKNLSYADLLHDTGEYNIILLRVQYPSNILGSLKVDKRNAAKTTMKQIIEITINAILNGEVSNQYVLAKLDSNANIEYIKALKAKDHMDFDAEYGSYSYFDVDLNTFKYYDTGVSAANDFDIKELF